VGDLGRDPFGEEGLADAVFAAPVAAWVRVPRPMTTDGPATDPPENRDAGATKRFIDAGLEMLDLGAGEAELAVIEVVDAIYRPPIEALLDAELDGVEPEPGADMSRGPRSLEQR
jgi:hypothetical protein